MGPLSRWVFFVVCFLHGEIYDYDKPLLRRGHTPLLRRCARPRHRRLNTITKTLRFDLPTDEGQTRSFPRGHDKEQGEGSAFRGRSGTFALMLKFVLRFC